MFIVTAKFSKKKALIVVFALALVLFSIIVFAGRRSQGEESNIIPVEEAQDIINHLESLGWQVNPDPVEVQAVLLPREFSEVFEAYNEMQLALGFDLRNYKGMEAMRYTFAISNYPGHPEGVVADVLVAQNRIIGGDIQSLRLDGFIHGLVPNRQ